MRKVWEWDIMSAEMKSRYSPRPAPHGGTSVNLSYRQLIEPMSTYCTSINLLCRVSIVLSRVPVVQIWSRETPESGPNESSVLHREVVRGVYRDGVHRLTYRGTSLIRKHPPLGPYHRPVPRVIRES